MPNRNNPAFTGLILVSGEDHPGITQRLMSALAQFAVTILDIEQLIIRDRLVLTVLITLDQAHAQAISDELKVLEKEIGLDIAIDFDQQEQSSQEAESLRVVIIGDGLKPSGLAAVAAEIANLDGNITAIRRTATTPLTAIELDLTISNHSIKEVQRALASVAIANQIDLAVEPGGRARNSKRLVVLDMDSTLIQQEVIDLLAKHANKEAAVSKVTAAAMAGELDFAQALKTRVALLADLDVSVIDELPPGRKPITTIHRFENHRLRLFGFMKEQIQLGRQIYIVYPLIQESEKLDFANLMDGYEAITRSFPLPQYRVSMVHGQMKPEDKDFEMQRFIKGETQIMVATTVIEVGVNVPNASVMIIESAERFGLSQLHQLRGRVGRGAEKSYCILLTGNKLSKEAKLRMETMERTNDGFEIAEVDLKLRGPGDLMGTQQSGVLDLKIADISKDSQLVVLAREIAIKLVESDPDLSFPPNLPIRNEISKIVKSKPNWGKIA